MKGRKLDDETREALKVAIVKHLQETKGHRPKWGLVLKEFDGISASTLLRVKRQVLKENEHLAPPPERVKATRRAARKSAQANKNIPRSKIARAAKAAAMAGELIVSDASGARPTNLLAMWQDTVEKIDDYVLYARGRRPETEGEGKAEVQDDPIPFIQHPSHYAAALQLRTKVHDNMLKATTQIWNCARVQLICEVIIRNLRGMDPEFADRVYSEVERAFEEVGLSAGPVRH